ncbi:hypothetical protein RUM43_001109 [Polyplax serrata]|uniref:Cysteine dioxygenase n=1 Tax=Polyplax serrata TaxID=468196 RepID=A0AAN8SHC4_POLSC
MMVETLQNGTPSRELNSTCEKQRNMYDIHLTKCEKYGNSNRKCEASSLQDLIAKLYEEFDKDVVDVDYICDLMTSYKSVPNEWKKYAKFDRYRYTRNLVDSGNGKFNIMVLCWGEGHGSAIHDHADAHCFMKVIDGTLSEVRFEFPNEESGPSSEAVGNEIKETGRTHLNTNEVCYINDSLGLHRVENPSHVNPAVSLHVYSPPFDSCSVFNQHTGQKTKCKVTFWSKYGEHKTHEERAPEDN